MNASRPLIACKSRKPPLHAILSLHNKQNARERAQGSQQCKRPANTNAIDHALKERHSNCSQHATHQVARSLGSRRRFGIDINTQSIGCLTALLAPSIHSIPDFLKMAGMTLNRE